MSTVEETAARALNEQGFLLAQRIRQEAKTGYHSDEHSGKHTWLTTGFEFPVTARNGQQTRIDLVLARQKHEPVLLSVECKRAHPSYKRWLFFGKSVVDAAGKQKALIEKMWRPDYDPNGFRHRVNQVTLDDVPCFDYYLEAKVDTNGKWSSTETIETAFSQVLFGQSGLFKKYEDDIRTRGPLWVIPVIVTTAQLYKIELCPEKVQLGTGMIANSDVQAKEADFLAVNYHMSDNLALSANDIHNLQLDWFSELGYCRTVFVVSAPNVGNFLIRTDKWLDMEHNSLKS